MRAVTVAAPASTANLGAGFDVFGMALDGRHDTVRVAESGDHSITITADGGVPSDPGRNTAGIVAGAMRDEFGTGGAHITIRKGVPAGYGMGSSAASAAAAAVAFNELFGLGLDRTTLVRYAGYGERASAGSIHYDNVAASVCGGFVIVRTDPLGVTALRPPEGLALCVAVPDTKVPEGKTRVSRGVVPKSVPLGSVTANVASAASMVAGVMGGDIGMMGESVRDMIAEPARMGMIPGYGDVRRLAVEAGAAGVTISGAGPSVIALMDGDSRMAEVRDAMREGFARAGVGCTTIPCRPAAGAHITGDSP